VVLDRLPGDPGFDYDDDPGDLWQLRRCILTFWVPSNARTQRLDDDKDDDGCIVIVGERTREGCWSGFCRFEACHETGLERINPAVKPFAGQHVI